MATACRVTTARTETAAGPVALP
uniref:Uncharacterized protein n=1 Tax=Arundo donax TaxID=35708 RepID=A0A0A8Y5H0_ARUDO